ncbi:MAG TPA: hypothetical protein DD713_08305 [Nitrospiraceae bacterium]|nr:hypothetical protein [Nitrospiraceae bacterium]
MKIDRVDVTYGELRSAGYPSFSNKRIEVTLGAKLEQGDIANVVQDKLFTHAKTIVKKRFGDTDAEQTEIDIPF